MLEEYYERRKSRFNEPTMANAIVDPEDLIEIERQKIIQQKRGEVAEMKRQVALPEALKNRPWEPKPVNFHEVSLPQDKLTNPFEATE